MLLVLAAVVAATALTEGAADPEPASAPAGEFSAERAREHLDALASEPRPLGSAANERAEGHLVRELRAAGLEVEVQETVGARADGGLAAFGRVDNIVATLPGTDPTGTVLVATHFDTSPLGPGAADATAAVAATLETVRALRTGDRPRNDIVVLITDGEEDGLLGAAAFVREHPLAGPGTVVLNWEARGVSGPSLMFETSRDNAALVDVFTGAAAHPRGDSSMVEVYRALPNDTDFTVFTEAGMTGLNSAFIEGAARYHTAGDTVANLDAASLQHHGANMLALTRALGGADLGALRADHDDTYFRVLGLTVSYPNAAVWPLAALGLLVAGLAVWSARRRGTTSVPRVLAAFGSAPVALAAGFAMAQGVWTVLTWLRPSYDTAGGLLHRPVLYHVAMLLAGFLALAGWYLALRRRVGPVALALGGLAWPAVLGVLCAAAAPGASFLFTVPALAAAAGMLAAQAWPRWSVPAIGLALVPAAAMLPYFGYMTFVALGLELAGVGALFAVLSGLLLLPVLELFLPDRPGRRVGLGVPAAVLVACAALVAGGLAVDTADPGHPAPTHLAYVLDADTGTARWVSAEPTPSDWTAGHADTRDTRGLPPGYARGEVWTGDAPAIDEPGPEVAVLSRTGDTVTVRVASGRAAPTLVLRVDAPLTAATVTMAGHDPVTVEVPGARTGTWPGEVKLHDLPADGAEVTLRTGAARLTVFDETRGLAGLPGFTERPDHLTAGPRDDGELVAVARTVRLRD